MSRGIRSAITGLMGIVMAAALGFAALRDASAESWAGVMLLTTCAVLMLAVIGVVCRAPSERPWWLGCAVFGWGYFALAHWCSFSLTTLPTINLVNLLSSKLGVTLDPGSGRPGDLGSLSPFLRIAHYLWSLLIGVSGGTLTARLFTAPEPVEDSPPEEQEANWWRRPATIVLAGFGLVLASAVAGQRSAPGTWAGVTFLLTCGLMGLAALGAVFGRGRRREAWIGASTFGFGYLILTFGPLLTPDLPANHLLNAVFRPSYPPMTSGLSDEELVDDEESRRISKVLDEPISIHFSKYTPLKTVLKPIKERARASLGKDLLICAAWEPSRGLRMDFDEQLVSIDRENIPMKDALRLCLSQLGLSYRVQSGYLRIYLDEYQPIRTSDDPVMIVGHSLLALLAAAFGGLAAPFVSSRCTRPVETT